MAPATGEPDAIDRVAARLGIAPQDYIRLTYRDLQERDAAARGLDEPGDMVPLKLGFRTQPAPSNDPTIRINAVGNYLNKMVFGDPGYVADKMKCPLLRKGKNGQYCHKRVAVAGQEEVYKDLPNKNMASHTADAEQYLALGFVGGFVNDSYFDSEEDDNDDQNAGRNEVSGY